MATKQTQHSGTDRLADAVYHCLSQERYAAGRAFDAALPKEQKGDRTIHELDLTDFALTAGLAYGIARGEDPYESGESVVARASAAAVAAFERFGRFETTYEQDRAARPVPVLYPYAAGDTAKPWEPLEDLANGLERCEALVNEDERKQLKAMRDRVGQMVLDLFQRQSPTTDDEEA
jgi:hypothetical protein